MCASHSFSSFQPLPPNMGFLMLIHSLVKVWHFSKGGSVSSIHPPITDLQLHLEGVPILATPFRKGRGGEMVLLHVLTYTKFIDSLISITQQFPQSLDN